MISRLNVCFAICMLAIPLSAVSGQEIFSSDLDDGTGWTIIADADTESEFGFDYSPFGIPSAPNGTGTTGLRMAANIADAASAVISATPDGVDVSGLYTVQFDFYINYNSSGGTTEFIGGYVGFNVADGNPRSGAGFLGDSDGDSARDFRLYKDANEQFIASGQYNPVLDTNNGGFPNGVDLDMTLQEQFPGQTTPAEQGMAPFDPINVIVDTPDGTLGYGWHTMLITADSAAGTANFAIDGFSIGTLDTNTGDPVDVSGGIALTYADLFSSVSTKPEFSFGVFDNLVVTQIPEPSSVMLLISAMGMLWLRRR